MTGFAQDFLPEPCGRTDEEELLYSQILCGTDDPLVMALVIIHCEQRSSPDKVTFQNDQQQSFFAVAEGNPRKLKVRYRLIARSTDVELLERLQWMAQSYMSGLCDGWKRTTAQERRRESARKAAVTRKINAEIGKPTTKQGMEAPVGDGSFMESLENLDDAGRD